MAVGHPVVVRWDDHLMFWPEERLGHNFIYRKIYMSYTTSKWVGCCMLYTML